MVVILSPKIKKEVFSLLGEYGYKTERDFVEDALRRRILELKKSDFLSRVRKIREKMAKKGLKEKDILEDFYKFYHK